MHLEPNTLVKVVRAHAERVPGRIAFRFLEDGEERETAVSYAELDRRARRIAVALLQVAEPGNRALLLHEPGPNFICAYFGCLFAGWAPIPAQAPHPARLQRTLPRIHAIIRDAQPGAVLTTASLGALTGPLLGEATRDGGTSPSTPLVLATDQIPPGAEDDWHEPAVDGDTIALIQYTSGSVDTPRGVMVSHANLLHNLGLIAECDAAPADGRVVSWLPHYHDMGLIGGILYPIWSGHEVILMSPLHFLMRPLRWLGALSLYQAHTSVAPNFAYALCVPKIDAAARKSLDLSHWSVAFVGAEPISADVLDVFTEAFAPCGFRRETFLPCYGLAESTLIVTGSRKAEPPRIKSLSRSSLARGRAVEIPETDGDATRIVSCGTQLAQGEVRLVDPKTRQICPPSIVGEIWIRSPSVAKGYWNRPEPSWETFGARLADGSGPYLRTGDLGVLLEGELYVVDRLKDLIIIQARNLYAHDIEASVARCHRSIRMGCVAAFSVEAAGQERLVVVAEVERRPPLNRRMRPDEPAAHTKRARADDAPVSSGQVRNVALPMDPEPVFQAVREAVARYFETFVSAVVLIRAGTIAKTTSGKIQRRKTKTSFLDATLEVIAEKRFDS